RRARLRPTRLISASTSTSRPSRDPSPRTIAWGAPSRIIASVGAPRIELAVARYPIASRRFVLPSPLRPTTAVSPASRVRSASSYDLKPDNQSRSSRTARRSDPHGHQHVAELVAVGRAEQGRSARVHRLEHDL